MTSAAARQRWRLVRRGRYRRALDALREGRADDALRALTHPGSADDERAELLSAIATVMSMPTLPSADRCVAALERASGDLDPGELSLATAVLEPALRQGPGAGPDLVAHVALLTGRLTRLTGPLPWGHYNLAVRAMCTGEFGAAARHLDAGASAPAGGWPPALLGAACAAALGEPALLSRWLTGLTAHQYFAHDHWFLLGVHDVFTALSTDRPADRGRLGGVFGGASGPLTLMIPQLSALKSLLADAIAGAPPRARPADLAGCSWARWLRDRLGYAGGRATDVLAVCPPEGDDEPAVIWQRLGSQQDLLALVPEPTARFVRERLVDFEKRFDSGTDWTRLAELRVRLGAGSPVAATAVRDPDPGPCPWWPAGGALQVMARHEGEVERRYLEGRHALHRGRPADAGRWFNGARARLAGAGMATGLVGLRFGPLLDYWEGVALAHLGFPAKSAELLRRCADGIKAREARAQLGLLAVATGDHAEAARRLATMTEPRPAAADYLAALLAERGGGTSEAEERLERIERRDLTAGVYAAAGQRLRGRMHESRGEMAEAAIRYRRSLTHRPDDTVAAFRLARVWLRQRYDADVPSEPLLDARWPVLTGGEWGAPLLTLRHCLDPAVSLNHESLDRVPRDPALRLLVLHTALVAGQEDLAMDAAVAWGEEDEPDPELAVAAHTARAVRRLRDFCRADGQEPARSELAELEGRLRAGRADPRLAFWAGAAGLTLSTASIRTAPPLAAVDDESRPPAERLFAGLMSVFSEDPEQRRAGARCCRAALEAEPTKDALVRAAVRCLAADALADDQEFLAAYGEIETEVRTLPCDPAAVYLAATEARLRVGALDAVIDGFIPDQLADLADPGVRNAMGIAYARRAARGADRDPRAALRDLDQARELLQEQS